MPYTAQVVYLGGGLMELHVQEDSKDIGTITGEMMRNDRIRVKSYSENLDAGEAGGDFVEGILHELGDISALPNLPRKRY